ncbi:MAG: mandelate racemase/muconate lactonizing enzyme family protein [SAR202 cluster bacterium]|nr:mandelate racemase/muconate lactonizing enzyme family protein [SAR202 cluster bacterium]
MKITNVEVFPIYPPLAKRYRDNPARNGHEHRVAAKVTTDIGITGFGDFDGSDPPPSETFEPLIDTNPFNYIGSDLNPAVVMAMYDIMGKYLEIPAYKLIGQKRRDGVSSAAWCWGGPTKEELTDDIIRATNDGYTIFKIHTNPLEDVFEWTKAIEEVAPPGFKVHLDFTGRRGRTLGSVLPIVAQLERNHPIIGWIEDPFDTADIESWRELRRRTQLPIVHGGTTKLGGGHEALMGMADAYMMYPPIGNLINTTTTMGKLNLQVILQFCGGTLAKSMAMHIACTMPTATGHSIHLDDQLDAVDDITHKRFSVAEGFSRVSEEPGLGFEVDEELLYKYKDNVPDEIAPYIGVVRLGGGHSIYSLRQPNLVKIMGQEEGTIRNFTYNRWFDDGSEQWAQTYERVTNEEWYID